MKLLLPDTPPKAVVLVAHGLNQRAAAMRPLFEAMRERGAAIVALALHGHRYDDELDPERLEQWRQLTWRDWSADWLAGSRSAAELASTQRVPLHFVGYSLGALVHIGELSREAEAPAFSRQVLLAPAIRLRATSRTMRFLRVLGRRFIVPAATPAAIRSHRGTSIAAYEALYHYEASVATIDYVDRLRIPTLVLVDRHDELVSATQLENWIARHDLAAFWRVEHVEKDRREAKHIMRHYITDEVGLGAARFQALVERVGAHLQLPGSRP